jgi:uncharacterized protein YndB with AHSA1/START domain
MKPSPVALSAKPPVSDEAVKKRTGRDWDSWCKLLDREGASAFSHREIVKIVRGKHRGGDWWSQMITVGYERLRGLREVNERAGGFAVSASKTINAAAANAFAAWTDARRRARWLVGVKLTIRQATAPKSVRLTCKDDNTEIAVMITAKGRCRCVVAVDHTRLANAQLVAERRHCWKEMLRNLTHYLEERA